MKDAHIRKVVKQELLAAHGHDKDTVFCEELTIRRGGARIDYAVVNGVLHGFEFKSESDTLDRLPKQVVAYNTIFDLITLVISESHLCNALEMVPPWWGLTVARRTGRGVVLRDLKLPLRNPVPQALALASLLRRRELVTILSELGCLENLKHDSRRTLRNKLLEKASITVLQDHVRKALKERQSDGKLA